jgi:hypothetical protein
VRVRTGRRHDSDRARDVAAHEVPGGIATHYRFGFALPERRQRHEPRIRERRQQRDVHGRAIRRAARAGRQLRLEIVERCRDSARKAVRPLRPLKR